jgi:hypothetical protein
VVSIISPIALETLADMPTKQLLGLRDRLLACEESLQASDADASEIDVATIRFKDDPRWVALYNAVKATLATREHVPGGDQRRAKHGKRARGPRQRARR